MIYQYNHTVVTVVPVCMEAIFIINAVSAVTVWLQQSRWSLCITYGRIMVTVITIVSVSRKFRLTQVIDYIIGD